MTRADRATSRPEFAARFTTLSAAADTGRQALAAQGALAVLWHEHATASGFIPMNTAQTAAALDVDERTWRHLAQLLEETGLLCRHEHGYQVAAAQLLEGTRDATGTDGFLRTHRATYGQALDRIRRAGQLEGRRGAYALAAIGAFEVLRVTRANWRTGVTRWSTVSAGQHCGLSAKSWAGYLRLLEHALVLQREGTRVRVLGWRQLVWGPSSRFDRRPAGTHQVHNTPILAAEEVHNSPGLSTPKARTEVTNSPLPPAGAAPPAPIPLRLRRGEHPDLQALFEALEARVPGAAHGRWRRPVRQELSHALAAAGGDVAALAAELTRRDLATARDIPSALAWRCGQAVELIRARQASQQARERVQRARADNRAQEASSAAQASLEASLGARLAVLDANRWAQVQDQVADALRRPRIGAPGNTAGLRALIQAQARVRVRETVADLLARWSPEVSGISSSTCMVRDTRHLISAETAPDALLLQALDLAMARNAQEGASDASSPHPGTLA